MIELNLKFPCQATVFKISTDCPNICERLKLQHGAHISGEFASCTYDIKITRDNQSLYHFVREGKHITTATPLLELDTLLFEIAKFDESIIALHGAAVEFNDKSYAFLAPTTTGKTTLCTYLVRSGGMGYITEDRILLDEKNNVHPFTCPIHLRAGGLGVLEKYGVLLPELPLLEEAGDSRYIFNPENPVTTSLPLGKIFFISRTESENSAKPISTAEAIGALMKAAATVVTPMASYIQAISAIARTGCVSLQYSDMAYVKNLITSGVYG